MSDQESPGADRERDQRRAANAITALSLIETYRRITTGYGDAASIKAVEVAGLRMEPPVAIPFALALLACRMIQIGGDDPNLRLAVQLSERMLEQATAELQRWVDMTDARGLY